MKCQRFVSVYRNSFDTVGVTASLDAVIKKIQTGEKDLDEKTRYCNALAITEPAKYKKYKEKELPAVTFSGTFPKGKRKAQHLSEHSGYMTLDIDGLTAEQIPELLAALAQNPYVRFAFVSPSGVGIKVIVRVDPIPANDLEHKGAYQACLDFFDDLATEYGFTIDTTGKDCSRLCYLSHHRTAIVHTDTPPIDWDKADWLTAEKKKQERFEADAKIAYTGEVDTKALDYIDPNDLDYNQWLSVITACKQAGLTWQQVDLWSRRGGVRYTEGEVETRWQGLRLDVSWGAVINLAKINGYKPPTHRKPVKLQNVQPYGKVIETLKTAREFLKGIFEKGSNFFAIRTDTGTGKTERGITYAITRDVAIPTQSGKLRDEIVSRAIDKEIFAWGYRGIRETEEADGYMLCIQAERFEALRDKGFNPYKFVCEDCNAYLECKERGYLSQPDRAKQSQLVALPFPTAFLDPRLRSWADLYKPRGKNALILHDDLPLGSLFLEYQLTAGRLRQIYEKWKGTLASEWAEVCLMAFQLRDWGLLKRVALGMKADDKESVRYALTQCIDPTSGAVVEPDDYLKSEQVDFSTADACRKLPQVDKEGFDVATMLESFWEQYPRVEDAPFFFDSVTDTFTFYRPPKPYIFNKSLRFGFASATLDPKLTKAIFPDIEFYDANTTEWKNGGELYQLRTNRNPRATVLKAVEKYNANGEKVWEWDGLSETGADYYEKVLTCIKSNPNETHAVLSYKAVIADKQHELDALGVRTAHFGNLAGLDTVFDGVKNFHILFCPFVKPSDVDFLCKQLFGNEETPLKRDVDGNLERNTDEGYEDERALQVNDALVVGELLQAIGRARLNLYPNRVFLWTSLFIDGVSNRDETTLFDELDWGTADGDLSKLRDTVSAREKGDAKELAQRTGESERNARRQTQPQQQQSKAELQQTALTLYAQGESYREIGAKLNKAPNTIKTWCQTETQF